MAMASLRAYSVGRAAPNGEDSANRRRQEGLFRKEGGRERKIKVAFQKLSWTAVILQPDPLFVQSAIKLAKLGSQAISDNRAPLHQQ